MKKIQLGISGMGRIGKIHTQNVQRNSAPVGIKAAYHTNPNTKAWAQLQGVTHFYDHYKELIEDPAIINYFFYNNNILSWYLILWVS